VSVLFDSMQPRKFTVQYEINAPNHHIAFDKAVRKLKKSLAVGFSYTTDSKSLIVTGNGSHRVQITFTLTHVPKRVQTNLAFNTFFPDAIKLQPTENAV